MTLEIFKMYHTLKKYVTVTGVALRSQHLTATGPGRRGSRLCHPR